MVKVWLAALILCFTCPMLAQDSVELPAVIAIQQQQIEKLRQELAKIKDPDGSIRVNGSKVVDATGKWVGSPSGLKGDKGDKGDQGLTGPKGSFASCQVVRSRSSSPRAVATCPAHTKRTGGGCLLQGTFSTSIPATEDELSWQCSRKEDGSAATIAYVICCA